MAEGIISVRLKVAPIFIVEGEGVEELDEDAILDYIQGWLAERPLTSMRVLRREKGRVEVEVDFHPM